VDTETDRELLRFTIVNFHKFNAPRLIYKALSKSQNASRRHLGLLFVNTVPADLYIGAVLKMTVSHWQGLSLGPTQQLLKWIWVRKCIL